MSQFKEIAKLEVPGNISKNIVNQNEETILFEFSSRESFMVKAISFTLALIMIAGAIMLLFVKNSEAKWQVFFIMLTLSVPPFLVFIVSKKNHKYCLLDFKNMKIKTGTIAFSNRRNILTDDISNIEFILLDSVHSENRSSYVAYEHHAAFINKEGKRFFFTGFYSEVYYKEVFEYLKKISDILKLNSFTNEFIKNTIIQYLKMFPKYAYITMSLKRRFKDVLEPLLDMMNLEHINMLLEALNKHPELRNRKIIREPVLQIIEKKFNDRIVREKYPEIFR